MVETKRTYLIGTIFSIQSENNEEMTSLPAWLSLSNDAINSFKGAGVIVFSRQEGC